MIQSDTEDCDTKDDAVIQRDYVNALMTRLALLAGNELLVEVLQAGVGEHRQ